MEIIVFPMEWKLWPLFAKGWRDREIVYAIYLGPLVIYPHGR